MAQGTADPVVTDVRTAAVWAHSAMLCRMPRRTKAEGPARDASPGKAEAGGLGNMMSENGEQSSPGGA